MSFAACWLVFSQEVAPTQIYEDYRAWLVRQPSTVQRGADVLERYKAELIATGVTADVAATRIQLIGSQHERLEAERWNRILTSTALFNSQPNQFLMEVVRDAKPGKALDFGVGEGRNALYLAGKGWDAGFDRADKAVALAQKRADAAGLKVHLEVRSANEFDWGEHRWDLIVATYEPIREFRDRMVRALKPGGIVIIEAVHSDSGKSAHGAVVFESNELLHLFDSLRVLRYEDRTGVADFGPRNVQSRIVNLAAQKP